MSLRSRILLASGLLTALPLLLLTAGIRAEMERRLTAQYTARITTLMAIIEEDLHDRGQDLQRRLAALKEKIGDDNRFRLAAVGQSGDQRYLLDFAGKAMGLMGLDLLQVQDGAGQILSSGHFRNEYGRHEKALPSLLAATTTGNALITARLPDGPFLALAGVDSLRLGENPFHLVGGFRVDPAFLADLARDRNLVVSVVTDAGALSSDPRLQSALAGLGRAQLARPEMALDRQEYLVRGVDLPLVVNPEGPAGSRLGTARLVVTHPLSPLQTLLRSLNLWLGIVLLATLGGTLALAFWLSGRISRPLGELARQTASLDLDRLEVDFATDRQDEVGTLSRFLAAMTARLRASVARLRETERRATLGELARQVNHDIRNGLTPLRNVIRHLAEVAAEGPDRMSQVFGERHRTLEAGLSHLEELAGNYARLSPARQRRPCSLNDTITQTVVPGPGDGPVDIHLDLDPDLPDVLADPVGLRRIVDNLVRNARESCAGGPGTVTVTTGTAEAAAIVLTVRDDGCGIDPADLDRIFNDFFTTKEGGTGLGLSNVRRLVADCEGTIEVESEPGRGTTFRVTLPPAPASKQTKEPAR